VFADFGDRCQLVYDGLAFAGVMVRFFPHRPEIATGLRITLPDSDEDFAKLVKGLEICLAPQALVFDLDGVLADVEESYRRCVVETVRRFGVEISRRDVEEAVHAGNANSDWHLVQRILRQRGIDVSLETVIDAYQRLYLGTEVEPGLRERERILVSRDWLERLAQRYPLGIVTGRPREEAVWFLERHGLMDFFATTVCQEDGPLKPDPAPVERALAELAVSRAWMIGDTPDDVLAASGAGALPIGVVAPGDDPERSSGSLRRAGAVAVLPSTTALEELLP
jgi:HAD superfamily phosphatase